ncbi:MAG TPA: hypothetical protein VGO73_11175 [Pyrinomonadaceae bacterium]|nr:hypothetical protein [Pyrinomonadaceae bacterium]
MFSDFYREAGSIKNGVGIRLTDERWAHIREEHGEISKLQAEVLKAIRDPLRIVEGNAGELLAVRELEVGNYLVVVYREVPHDGFVITAFVTRRIRSLERRKQLWP